MNEHCSSRSMKTGPQVLLIHGQLLWGFTQGSTLRTMLGKAISGIYIMFTMCSSGEAYGRGFNSFCAGYLCSKAHCHLDSL